jgi:transcriptional antiterminator
MAKNTPKQIRERREKIMKLMSHGYYLVGDIAEELKISRRTVNSDMKHINEMNNKQFYELAKSDPLTDYVNNMDRVINESWKMYNDPNTSPSDKLQALKTISDINERKLATFQDVLGNYDYHHHDHDMT